MTSKLTALIEAAKAATSPYADDWESKQALLKFDRAANPTTILELCALLEKAEEALKEYTGVVISYNDPEFFAPRVVDGGKGAKETLAAIKQWKGEMK